MATTTERTEPREEIDADGVITVRAAPSPVIAKKETFVIPSDNSKMPALYAALAIAQGDFPPIRKNRSVTIKPREGAAYTFNFTDLFGILQAIRPAMKAQGLGVLQPVIVDDDDVSWLLTIITHADGAALVSKVAAPQPTADPKQYGGLLTYMRRYMLTAILCLATDDDLDDNGQEGGRMEDQSRPAAAPPPQRRSAAAPSPAAPSPAAAAPKPDTTAPPPKGPARAPAAAGITPGQLKNLQLKLDSLDLDEEGIQALLERCGVEMIDDRMPLADWQAVKREIDAMVKA